jgi:hypothetical protein
VDETVVNDQRSLSVVGDMETPAVTGPQAGAELAHEMVSVARAMFAYLRPGAAGVDAPSVPPATQTTESPVAPPPVPAALPVPAAPADAPADAPAAISVPSVALPAALPVPEPVLSDIAPVAAQPETDVPLPTASSRSMALLNEIAFLDD